MTTATDGIWFKVASWVLSTCFTISIGLITHTLIGIDQRFMAVEERVNTDEARLVRMEAWRENVITTSSVPRTELDLRDKVIAAQMTQFEIRLQEIERRRQ